MNPLFKLWFKIKSNVWLLAAFLVPLAIRSIPEVLSWPYPLGLDTLRIIPLIESGSSVTNASAFIHYQLFYPMATLLYKLVGNPIVLIKLLGPILMGSVAVMMYLYARKGLNWGTFKSFLVSLLVPIYFVSLRNSWDLYAQSFALIFLFATLIIFKSSNSPKRFVPTIILIILTVLAHQLVSVILLVILGLEAIRALLLNRQFKDFAFTFISLGLGGALFLLRTYSPIAGTIVVPFASVSSTASINLAFFMLGLLFYCYLLLLPFVALGVLRLKDWMLRFWTVWCISVIAVLMVAPDFPLYYWNRWVFLLVYPILFFAVEGLDSLWHFCFKYKSKLKRLIPKSIAIAYILMLGALSGFYLAAAPDNQMPFFSSVNPYLSFVPSSMLQNTLSIKDNSDFIDCVHWINDNADSNSLIVEHYALYDLLYIYNSETPAIAVREGPMWFHIQNQTSLVDGVVLASKEALTNGNSTVYTVWWIDGQGWYNVISLPSNFKEVYHAGEIAVYIFNPNT